MALLSIIMTVTGIGVQSLYRESGWLQRALLCARSWLPGAAFGAWDLMVSDQGAARQN